MKKQTTLSIINFILILILLSVGFFFFLDSKKEELDIAFVDNIILFNEFNMTKEIKIIEEKKINTIKKELDSIYGEYQKNKDKESQKIKELEALLNSKNQLLQSTQKNYTANLRQKVWSRLNDYINAYAKNNKIKVVFGTNGTGNLMYAEDKMNITSDVLLFSNQKYEGKLIK